MLRLAVVHYQPGPNWDFSGDGSDVMAPSTPGQEVTIEDTPFSIILGPDRVLPMKFEAWDEKYDQVAEAFKKKDPSGALVTVKQEPKRRACVSMDLDGVMAANPRELQKLIEKYTNLGCEFHLVTSRHESERPVVESFCNMYGIKFVSMSFCPLPKSVCEDLLMDVRVGAWKADRIEELGANAVIENRNIHTNIIANRMPGILIFRATGE